MGVFWKLSRIFIAPKNAQNAETKHQSGAVPILLLALLALTTSAYSSLGVSWESNPDLSYLRCWSNHSATSAVNSGLQWVFSKRSDKVVFMDLQLKIEGKKIVMSLFAKPMALHLYIPPHSCHAPGSLLGIVFGNDLAIHQLCSRATNIVRELKLFFLCLLDQGYQSLQLMLLFQQAIDNAKNYLQCTALDHVRAKSRKDTAHCRRVFLHLLYHPANPSSKSIQKLWCDVVATPKGQTPLHCLTNQQGYNVPIEQLTIAWHHPHNLPNLLSYRKLENHTGMKVSSFIKT